MRIYISGGPNRQRFSSGLTQKQIAMNIKSEFPQVEVVKSGTTDYIVIENDTCEPSATALATGGSVITLNEFMQMMRRKKTSKKKSSKKKYYRGNMETLVADPQEDEEKQMTKEMQNLKVEDMPMHPTTVFAKYVSFVHMLISGALTPENFVTLMQKTDIVNVIAPGNENKKLKAAWTAYCEEIKNLSGFFQTKKNQTCDNAMNAQRALGLKTDRIATAIYTEMSISESVVIGMLDFCTNSNNTMVQLMVAKDNETQSLAALDQLLTSALEFASSLK